MKVKDLKIDYVSHVYLINKEDRYKKFIAHYVSDLTLDDVKKLYPNNECKIIDASFSDDYYVVCSRKSLEVYI